MGVRVAIAAGLACVMALGGSPSARAGQPPFEPEFAPERFDEIDAAPEAADADNPADPNADYVINWNSLTSSAQIGVIDGSMNAQITLQGVLQIPTTRNPAAYIIEITDVVDDRGRSLLSTKLNRWSNNRAQQFTVQRIQNQAANQSQWGIVANLTNLVAFSSSIDRVDGKLYILEVTGTRNADLDLAPAREFTDVGPGVAVRIDKVDRRSNSLTVNYYLNSKSPGMLNDLGSMPFLFKQELLDGEGREIAVSSSYNSMNGENQGYMRMYMQNAEDGPAKLRMVLATEAEERVIDFSLRDLRMNPAAKKEPAKDDKGDGAEAKAPEAQAGDAEDAPAPAPEPAPAPAPARPAPGGIDGKRFE